MIFELKFEFSSQKENLVFFIHRLLDGFVYSVFFVDDGVCLWVDCEGVETQRLEELVENLSLKIPKSMFMGDISSRVLEKQDMPKSVVCENLESFYFCPQCLETKQRECEVCKKTIPHIDEKCFEDIYTSLNSQSNVCVLSEGGKHIFSLKPSQRVYCVDIQSILEVCNVTQKEIEILASFEKPILRVRANLENTYGIDDGELRISFANDLFLWKLFHFLKQKGIKFLFGASCGDVEFSLAEQKYESQEVVLFENDGVVILQSPIIEPKLQEKFLGFKNLDKAFLSTIIAENNLQNKNILNFYFSFDGKDSVSLYNSKTQWFNEVLDFELPKDLFTLFEEISNDGESGVSLVGNYKNKFPSLCEKNVSFEGLPSGIFGIFEIAKIVLGFDRNPFFIARENLHQKGVAIEYFLQRDSLIRHKFAVAKCIRSSMSFKIAGAKDEEIALGYVESFTLLPSKIYLGIRDLVNVDGMSLCGSMFSSKMIGDFFYKNNKQTQIYRNKTFPLLFCR